MYVTVHPSQTYLHQIHHLVMNSPQLSRESLVKLVGSNIQLTIQLKSAE